MNFFRINVPHVAYGIRVKYVRDSYAVICLIMIKKLEEIMDLFIINF